MEYADEVDRAMNDLPPELVGLCVDTGHCAYANIDPMALIHRYASRLGHMHFKDIAEHVRAAITRESVGFFDAIARGIFCPLGEGVVDFIAVRDALESIRYAGVAVVEQDIDPAGDASPLDSARASYAFLQSVGLAPVETTSP
jgi:inosose dehydratase